MGLAVIYQKPRLSRLVGTPQVRIDLRRGVHVERVNQVWSTDLTDSRLCHGFIALVAILDWCSRDVLAWEVSATLDRDFCISALERALVHAQREIFNSDQGAQCTRVVFSERLRARGIQLSMDGRCITASSSACGEPSSTRTSLSTITGACPRPSAVWVGSAASLPASASIGRSTIKRQRPSTSNWPGPGSIGFHLKPAVFGLEVRVHFPLHFLIETTATSESRAFQISQACSRRLPLTSCTKIWSEIARGDWR